MAAFVPPSQVKAVVPLPTDKLSTVIVKVFIRFPIIVWRIWLWQYTEEGRFSTEYAALLCAAKAECPSEEST